MPDIKKIKLGDTTYNICDANAVHTETTLTITNKDSSDTTDLVYAVTNLVEGGTKGHAVTPTYTGLPTKAYVDTKIANLVDSAPEALNTLSELATALETHEDAYDALLETVGNKANKDDLATVATSGNYNNLNNKPILNGVEITGNKMSADLKLGEVTAEGGFQGGTGATASGGGGAVGNQASVSAGGAAVGYQAIAGSGFAGGLEANAVTTGGAVGSYAKASDGFAGGDHAEAWHGTDGKRVLGAVAIGAVAVAQADNAVQLGTGTNTNANTLQFKSYQLVDASGKIPADRLPDADSSAYAAKSHTHGNVNNSGQITATESTTSNVKHIAVCVDDNGTVKKMTPANVRTAIGAGTSSFTGYTSSNKLAASNVSGLATVAISGSYSNLTNKPTINGEEITGTKTSTDLKLGEVTEYGGFQAGTGASAGLGGAIGSGASASLGGAIGGDATATAGGAVGRRATTTIGGAVGGNAEAGSGGAVGNSAVTTFGGAVGTLAEAGAGFAGGHQAKARYAADGTTEISGAVAIGSDAKAQANDAVQLGFGTNANEGTLQFRDYQLVDASGKIPTDRLPLGITATTVAAGNHTHPYLEKLTYEWSKQYNASGTPGYLLIGSFPMYDTNLTIDIDSTTATTYHGTVLIATQNVSETSLGTEHTINVYGDPTGTISDAIRVVWNSGSRNYNVYFTPGTWSKTFIHVRAIGSYLDTMDTSTMCTFTTGTAPTTTSGLTVNNVLKSAIPTFIYNSSTKTLTIS